MSWQYEQSTGWMTDASGMKLAQGYSGAGVGKNNPDMEEDADQGPIPQGTYVILNPIDTPTHGPYVLPLSPHPLNRMFGRTGFLIHGDSVEHPGEASKGCIILPRFARERIWESGDHVLDVAAMMPMVFDPELAT